MSDRPGDAQRPTDPASAASPIPPSPDPGASREPRPILERIGLAAIALVIAIMFGGVATFSWVGGEPFLAIMGAIGCLMTIWVGMLTLLRG